MEVAVEAAALRKWRRERALKASSIAAGQRRLCVACWRRSGAIRRGGLGGKHLTSLGGEELGVSCSWRGRAACLASKGEILEARCDGEWIVRGLEVGGRWICCYLWGLQEWSDLKSWCSNDKVIKSFTHFRKENFHLVGEKILKIGSGTWNGQSDLTGNASRWSSEIFSTNSTNYGPEGHLYHLCLPKSFGLSKISLLCTVFTLLTAHLFFDICLHRSDIFGQISPSWTIGHSLRDSGWRFCRWEKPKGR